MEVENGGEDSPDEESEDDDDKPLKPKVQAKPSPVDTTNSPQKSRSGRQIKKKVQQSFSANEAFKPLEDSEDEAEDDVLAEDWLETGDPWLGKRIRRFFGRQGHSGTITAYCEETSSREALWQVRYEDDFVERLNLMDLVVASKAQSGWEKSGGVDRILAHRNGVEGAEPEYLVKWKGRSYRALTWENKAAIAIDHHGHARLRKFHNEHGYHGPAEGHRFPADYVRVDRVLEIRVVDEHRVACEPHALVKWRGMQYEEATWEPVASLGEDAAIAKYRQIQTRSRRRAGLGCPKRGSGGERYSASLDYGDGRMLRDYQVEGLNWMVHNWHQRQCCILADEMGLGKTAQTVATFRHLRDKEGVTGAFLVVAPLSTIQHWAREVEAWGGMNAVVYHGSASSREMIRRHEWDLQGKGANGSVKFDVLVTTYEIANQDTAFLSALDWSYLVVDEAHRLKNKKCQLLQSLKQLKYGHCHLLTGTPIQVQF